MVGGWGFGSRSQAAEAGGTQAIRQDSQGSRVTPGAKAEAPPIFGLCRVSAPRRLRGVSGHTAQWALGSRASLPLPSASRGAP